jgi:hypothetical protein
MGQEEAGEKYFHGPLYHDGGWNSTNHICCRLCKTKNPQGKTKHWAKGLCRACYRRLSPTHRLYNDRWNAQHSTVSDRRKSAGKKAYKQTDPSAIKFDDADIETVLDRYRWRCAYSGVPLQGFDHRRGDAFQLEYVQVGDSMQLVPVCRSVNCSKKSLTDPNKLKQWAEKNDIPFPFRLITVDEYYQSMLVD